MMDQEVKATWVARLRSGQDKQGTNALRWEDGSMCCLGVLAEVCGVPRQLLMEHYKYSFPNMPVEMAGSGAPPPGFAGLTAKDMLHLVRLNDRFGKTFPQIADWIEENL